MGKDGAESRRGESGVFVGIRTESSELIVLTDEGAIKVRTFRRKEEASRWDKDYFNMVKGLPWEPTPGSSSVEVRARFRPVGREGEGNIERKVRGTVKGRRGNIEGRERVTLKGGRELVMFKGRRG